MTERAVAIREADPEDLATVVRLVRMIHGRDHGSASVETSLFSLDPSVLRAWITYVDDDAVGLTSLQVRTLRWGDGTLAAGYWGNLYVRPEFRRLMIYPRLVFSMLKSAPSMGIDMVYTGTRRPHVAEAHTKLGFRQVGTFPVLIKPLLPFRLVAKHQSVGSWSFPLCWPLDGLYASASNLWRPRIGSDVELVEIEPSSAEASSVVAMMNLVRNGSVGQVWSMAYFEKRFAATIEGQKYSITAARRKGKDAAIVISCAATRGNGISACVIMELIFVPGEEETAGALLGEMERRARRSGRDCVLFLDGSGRSTRRVFDRLGYRVTKESYHMLVWPKTIGERVAPTDLENWRFAFSDHDAF